MPNFIQAVNAIKMAGRMCPSGSFSVVRRAFQAAHLVLLGIILAACGGGEGAMPSQARQGESREAIQAAPVMDIATGFTGNGWYWNPDEGGTGFFIEAQGKSAYLGVYVYDDVGRPTWVAALGEMQSDSAGYFFSGTLKRYTGGQAAKSLVNSAPVSTDVGTVTIAFRGDGIQSKATMQLPGGRTMVAQRFSFDAAGPQTYGVVGRPETGWYWDPASAGQGWGMEVQGNTLFMVMYHYRADGAPTWNIVQGSVITGTVAATFDAYVGGQTLTGSHRTAFPALTEAAYTVGLATCSPRVAYASQPARALQRFSFGRIPTGAECRSTYEASLTSPEEGSVAAMPFDATNLEGYWSKGAEFGVVDSDGRFYAQTTSLWNISGRGLTSVTTWTRGQGYTLGGTVWWGTQGDGATWSPAFSDVMYGGSGGGDYLARKRLASLYFSFSYANANARAADVASLQGRWSADDITLNVSWDGGVTGQTTGDVRGYCSITGKLTQTTPGSRKNLFVIELVSSNAAVGTQKACTLESASRGMGAVDRVILPDSTNIKMDRFRFHAMSAKAAWTVDVIRQ
ncbi:MAG: hypothetical protein KF796_17210 [Ramlibacter sp.]|nr:hypothetical protein [Ramlibacter sp.]